MNANDNQAAQTAALNQPQKNSPYAAGIPAVAAMANARDTSPLVIESRPSRVLALKMPAELGAEIDRVAAERNATRSAVMRAAIRAGLAQLNQAS